VLPIRRILVPTDFSPQAQSALALACSLARDHGGTICQLYVEEPPVGPGNTWPPQEREQLLAELRQLWPAEPGVPIDQVVRLGEPARAILEVARDRKCDLLVMGTHGRTGVRRLLMGSVAEQVVRLAMCPVLTLNHPFPVPAETPRETAAVGAV